MKHTIIFLLFIIINNIAFAQRPTEGRRDGGDAPKIGAITGSVIDAATKQPVEFASVQIVRARDSSIVGGALTDKMGKFSVEQLPFGKFQVKIDFVGYKQYTRTELVLVKPPDNIRTDLGEISIGASQNSLDAVVVTAERAQFVNTLDKKVFTVGKDIVNLGASASELLNNVPSVTVDIDGGVALRGNANVTILVDGKQSALMGSNKADILRQLPANSIESIEVITSPSAKYDPEGVSGIINIVLKKDKQRGFNGQVQLGIGTNAKYNGSISLNYRTPKYNLFGNYGYRNDRRYFNGAFQRDIFEPTATNLRFADNNISDGIAKNLSHNVRVGMDIYLNKTNTLGWSAGANTGARLRDELTQYNNYNGERQLYNYTERTNVQNNLNTSYDANVNYKKQFAKPKQDLTADVTYSQNISDESGNFTPRITLVRGVPANIQNEEKQFILTDFRILTVQTDYTHPFSDGGKLEAGAKVTNRNINTDLKFYFGDILSNRTNSFNYDEKIGAAYATYTNTLPFFNKIGYQVGLRNEYTMVKGTLANSSIDPFTNQYFGLFPSGNLGYHLTENSELRASFSRRIRRPSQEEVNPFPDYDSPVVLRKGNPALSPEFTNAYELSYLKNWKKHSLSLTAYFRRTENQIQRLISIDTVQQITNVTFTNNKYRDNYGLEAIAKNEILKWWTLTSTLNAYQSQVNTSAASGNISNSGFAYSARVQSNMTLPAALTLQLTGNYNSPFILPQGYFIGMNSLDIGIKKDFMKGLLNVALSVSDVFDTQRFEVHTRGYNFDAQLVPNSYFTQDALRKRETRVVTLNATYRFGNMKAENRTRRRAQEGEGGGGMDGGGM